MTSTSSSSHSGAEPELSIETWCGTGQATSTLRLRGQGPDAMITARLRARRAVKGKVPYRRNPPPVFWMSPLCHKLGDIVGDDCIDSHRQAAESY